MNTRPKLILSDFDGTLTEGEELGSFFIELLELLKSKKIPLVIVTGRSKSWAHFFLTHFSYLDFVLSEGGAVLSSRGKHDLEDTLYVDESEVERLEKFCVELKEAFPSIPLTADSWGRHADRAIDLKVLADQAHVKEKIEKLMDERNINHSCSNVHLNFWCGDIDKSKAVQRLLKDHFGLDKSECLFFGDSTNDESMFRDFNSVGVSNISKIIDRLKYKPSIILEGKENEGAKGVYSFIKNELN